MFLPGARRQRLREGGIRTNHRYVATTILGLEDVLASELDALGAAEIVPYAGGASFQGDRHLMMRACLWLRTAHRVRWILGEGRVNGDEALYRGARRVARWERLIPPDRTFAVDAAVRGGIIRDRRFAALRVKDAIVDSVREACGSRPSVDTDAPDVRVHLRVNGERATLSLDAAGRSLHERGYRRAAGPAPLRETLAIGALLLAGWDGTRPLVDPMCGSGTLAVEAAMLACGRAPGLERSFGFQRWPAYRSEPFEAILEEARAEVRACRVSIVGRETDPTVVAVARGNAERAGVANAISLETGTVDDAHPPEGQPGLLISNPPYGERLGDVASAADLYARLGSLAQGAFRGWRSAFLVAHEEHREAIGLPITRSHPLKNGALDVWLDVIAGASTG